MKLLLLPILVLLPFITYAQVAEIPFNSRYYYSGQIEETDHIQMNLHIDNLKVTGSFVMETSGKQFFVEGRMSQDKSGMGIRVYDSYQKYIASIEANIISDEDNFGKKLVGVYKPASTDIKKLILDKIAEFANYRKFNDTPYITLL